MKTKFPENQPGTEPEIFLWMEEIKIKPQSPEGYEKLGNIWRSQQVIYPAIRAYQKAVELNPDAHSLYRQIAHLYEQLGCLESAIAWYLNLGRILVAQKKLEPALDIYHQALKLCQDAAIYLNLGIIYRQQGKLVEALDHYNQAIALQPNFAQAYYSRGNTLIELEQFEEGVRNYQLAIAYNPNFADAYLNLGDVFQYQGKFDQAIINYLQVLRIEPNTTKVYSPLSHIMGKLGKMDDAHECHNHRLPRNLLKQYCELIQIEQQVFFADPEPPSKFIGILNNARAWVEPDEKVIIFNSQDRIIADVCEGKLYQFIISEQTLPAAYYIQGKVVLLTARWSQNYYHWMFDSLPRLQIMRDYHIDLEDIDKFVVIGDQKQFQQETLNFLGIPTHKIITNEQYPHIQGENLIVPIGAGWNRFSSNFLRQTFLPNQNLENPKDRIYISRKKAQRRHVINEDKVMQLLAPYGFKPVILESMSVQEQVLLFAKAKFVIGPHGAGLANIVFCQPGTKVIEFLSPIYQMPYYREISQYVDLDYYSLIGDGVPHSQTSIIADINVNIDLLQKILKSAGLD